jgi:hypothetical protein
MTVLKRILLFILLPTLAVLSFPPATITAAAEIIPIVAGFFILIGFFLWRGKSLALTFAIFLQGMNVIVRLMLFSLMQCRRQVFWMFHSPYQC